MSLYTNISNALFALLNQAPLNPGTFRYMSRRFVTWETLIGSIQSGAIPFVQPALFLFDGVGLGGGRIKYEQRGRGRPTVRVLSKTVVIYAQLPGAGTPAGPDSITPGGDVFFPLMEAVENVFQQVDSEGALTLGGLVSHCWIDGEGIIVTGELDTAGGQGMATLPVQIMLP
jgi:hypothetical protein